MKYIENDNLNTGTYILCNRLIFQKGLPSVSGVVTFIDYIMLDWLVPWCSASMIVHFADITGLGLFTHLYKHIAHGEERRKQDSVVIRQSWRTAVSLHSDAKRGQPTNCASKLGRLQGPHCKFHNSTTVPTCHRGNSPAHFPPGFQI